MLKVKGLTVKYRDITIVEDISFEVEKGSWMMMVGPNGAGKSTIVKAISQSIPYTGEILIDGMDAAGLKSRELARKLGVLSQGHYINYGFTAEEVIRLGNYSRKKGFLKRDHGALSSDENKADFFDRAVEITGIGANLKKPVTQLSGGELQRTFLAQLFTQDPEILILDEPTNHLDLIYQKQIMKIIDEWRKKRGRTIISVIHDLSLAKMFGTEVLVVNKGRSLKYGPVEEVMTPENLDPVYGMDVAGWIRSTAEVWHS